MFLSQNTELLWIYYIYSRLLSHNLMHHLYKYLMLNTGCHLYTSQKLKIENIVHVKNAFEANRMFYIKFCMPKINCQGENRLHLGSMIGPGSQKICPEICPWITVKWPNLGSSIFNYQICILLPFLQIFHLALCRYMSLLLHKDDLGNFKTLLQRFKVSILIHLQIHCPVLVWSLGTP